MHEVNWFAFRWELMSFYALEKDHNVEYFALRDEQLCGLTKYAHPCVCMSHLPLLWLTVDSST